MSNPSSSPIHVSAPAPQVELAAENARLQQQLAQQSNQGNALLVEYNKVKAEKAALEVKMHRGGTSKLLALAAKFTGQGGAVVEEWVDDLEKHFKYFHVADAEQVDTAVMLLKGHASHWWTALEARGEGTQVWSEFVVKIKEMFQPISSVDKARAALDSCVQGNRSVQAYADAFHRWIAYLPSMEEGDKKHRFTTNLSPALRQEVLKAKAKTLQEAIHAAVSAEAYGHFSRIKTGGYYPGRVHSYGQSVGHASSGSAPMEVSNVNQADEVEDGDAVGGPTFWAETPSPPICTSTGSGSSAREQQLLARVHELESQFKMQKSLNAIFHRGNHGSSAKKPAANLVPGVSKAEFERCRREGLCLKCKQPGHIARECSKPVGNLKF
jgi:hypothetical protein